jgi:putative flippase GtrA
LKLIREYIKRKDHLLLQFFKYGFSGALSCAVELVTFYLCATCLFLALDPDDIFVQLSEKIGFRVPVVTDTKVRLRGFMLAKGVSFVISNIVCYALNVLFVFKSGRHRRHREIIYFYTLSLSVILIAMAFSAWLISSFNVTSTIANILSIGLALSVNFAGRKYFVFKG